MKEEKEEIPLKTILNNFLNHVESLEIAREDSLKGEGLDQYEKEFQVIFWSNQEGMFRQLFLISGVESIQRWTQNKWGVFLLGGGQGGEQEEEPI